MEAISYLPLLAAVLAICGEGRYIYSILRGKTRPSFVAFFIFFTEMTIIFASAYSLGARESLPLIGTFVSLHLITLLLSIKYGFIHFSRFNVVCLALSFLGLFLWWQSQNAWYALIFNILVDVLGYVVIIRKLKLYPDTEDARAWSISLMAYVVSLFALTVWIPEEYLFSMSNVFWCGVIVFLSIRPRKRENIS